MCDCIRKLLNKKQTVVSMITDSLTNETILYSKPQIKIKATCTFLGGQEMYIVHKLLQTQLTCSYIVF